jgi:hypothetical protein
MDEANGTSLGMQFLGLVCQKGFQIFKISCLRVLIRIVLYAN